MWLLASVLVLPIAQAGDCLGAAAPSLSLAPSASCLLQAKDTAGRAALAALPQEVVRPNEGGPADVVEFGVLVKGFSGIDFRKQTWKADVILTLRWSDPRSFQVLPQGEKYVSLPEDAAKKLIWTPDVNVTNTDLEGYEVRSTSFFVNSDGVVNKTQRLLLRLRSPYNTAEFPYDKQALTVLIASSTYMSQDVRMTVIEDAKLNGADANLFSATNWQLENVSLKSVIEIDGSLRKSRGYFTAHVARDPSTIHQSLMLPSLLLVALAYTVFLLPVSPVFAMPRVVTSIFCFLSLLTISAQTVNMLPATARGTTWLEAFEYACKFLVSLVIFLNVEVEATYHIWGAPSLAKRLTAELRFGFPVAALMTIGACFLADPEDASHVCFLTCAAVGLVAALDSTYLVWRYLRKHNFEMQ